MFGKSNGGAKASDPGPDDKIIRVDAIDAIGELRGDFTMLHR